MKQVILTLTEDPDRNYRVSQLVNSTRLSIGERVERSTVDGWNATCANLTIRIVGLTPTDAQTETQSDFNLPSRKSPKQIAKS